MRSEHWLWIGIAAVIGIGGWLLYSSYGSWSNVFGRLTCIANTSAQNTTKPAPNASGGYCWCKVTFDNVSGVIPQNGAVPQAAATL